nr:capsid protein [Cressdnaviricota sp.]UOF82999.1 capsid protein [Cressdnaviricota sp.]
MPYGKKPTYQKRNYRKYSNRNNSLAKKAYRLAKKAYKLPELKYHEESLTPSSVSGTGSIRETCGIAEGSTDNQRIGATIHPTSLKIRCTFKLNAAATDTLIRMIVFRWISEAPASLSEILETATVNSFKSQNLRYQSEIMYDRVFRLSTAEKPELFLQKSIKLNKYISYPSSSSTSNRNGIYIAFVSDEAVNTPTITYTSRLFYRDP